MPSHGDRVLFRGKHGIQARPTIANTSVTPVSSPRHASLDCFVLLCRPLYFAISAPAPRSFAVCPAPSERTSYGHSGQRHRRTGNPQCLGSLAQGAESRECAATPTDRKAGVRCTRSQGTLTASDPFLPARAGNLPSSFCCSQAQLHLCWHRNTPIKGKSQQVPGQFSPIFIQGKAGR